MANSSSPARPEPPLTGPYYGIPFRRAVARAYAKFSTFSSRASRSEYWWWVLATNCAYLPLRLLIDVFTRRNPQGEPVTEPAGIFFLCLLAALAVIWFLPTLSLTVRRLHDANINGWVVLVGLPPAISVTPIGGWIAHAGPVWVMLFGLATIIGGIAMVILTLLPPDHRGRRFDAPQTHPVTPATVSA